MISKQKIKHFFPEILVFSFAFFTRFFRLNIPSAHMFDEVYHAFTAEQMFKGNPAAWEWWNPSPQGFAYEWTHPPLAKEFMVLAIAIFGDNSFAWRFFSALLGFGVIVLIYLITNKLFKNRTMSLLAAFIASLDGLLLVMSRIAMNDIYFVFFILLALFLLLHDKKILMGICIGLSLASKWTALFGIGILGIIYLSQLLSIFRKKKMSKNNLFKKIVISPIFFILIPLIIYLTSYAPFFAGTHVPPGTNQTTLQTFVQLQQEMYWYHTRLKAHHAYQSTPVQWIFDIRPIWIYADYKGNTMANVYGLGNPFIMLPGVAAIVFLIYEFIKKRKIEIGIIIISYFGFFLPWIDSPRIMFYYHYLPSVPFLVIALAYSLTKILKFEAGKILVSIFLIILSLSFVYFYPLWSAVYLPRCTSTQNCTSLYDSYFWIPSWK